MKNKVLWIIITIFVLIGMGVILLFGTKKKEITSIKSMHLSYSNGWSAYSYTRYDLEKKDDGYYVEIKPYGYSDDEMQEVKLSKKDINKIIEVLNKYNVVKWNCFHKSDQGVLDGDSFSFSLHTEDDIDVSASGYMRWPDNYRNVRDELGEIFNPLYEYKDDNVYE